MAPRKGSVYWTRNDRSYFLFDLRNLISESTTSKPRRNGNHQPRSSRVAMVSIQSVENQYVGLIVASHLTSWKLVSFSGCINHPLESINHLQYPWWMCALVYVEQCLYPWFLGYKIGKASSGAHYDQRLRPQEDIEDGRKIQPRISYEYTISKDRPGAFGGGILLPLAVTPGWSWPVAFSN